MRKRLTGRAATSFSKRASYKKPRLTDAENYNISMLIPITDQRKLVLEWVFRKGIGKWDLELPAGKTHPGEDPKVCAIRELREETGYRAKHVRQLGWFYLLPSRMRTKVFVFLAWKLKAGKPHRDLGERTRPKLVRGEDLDRVVASIRHGPSLAALSIAQAAVKWFVGSDRSNAGGANSGSRRRPQAFRPHLR